MAFTTNYGAAGIGLYVTDPTPAPKKKQYPRTRGEITFFDSPEWKDLRWRYKVSRNGICDGCHGRAKNSAVRHIVPYVHAPERALDFSNLRLLCQDCLARKAQRRATPANLGVPRTDQTRLDRPTGE